MAKVKFFHFPAHWTAELEEGEWKYGAKGATPQEAAENLKAILERYYAHSTLRRLLRLIDHELKKVLREERDAQERHN